MNAPPAARRTALESRRDRDICTAPICHEQPRHDSEVERSLGCRPPRSGRCREQVVVPFSHRRQRPRRHGKTMDNDCTVLVIEDDEAAREALCEFLATAGYQVRPLRNGVEALAALRELAAGRRAARSRHAGAGRLRGAAAHPRARPARAGDRHVRAVPGRGRRARDEARRDRLPARSPSSRLGAGPRAAPRPRRARGGVRPTWPRRDAAAVEPSDGDLLPTRRSPGRWSACGRLVEPHRRHRRAGAAHRRERRRQGRHRPADPRDAAAGRRDRS